MPIMAYARARRNKKTSKVRKLACHLLSLIHLRHEVAGIFIAPPSPVVPLCRSTGQRQQVTTRWCFSGLRYYGTTVLLGALGGSRYNPNTRKRSQGRSTAALNELFSSFPMPQRQKQPFIWAFLAASMSA